MQRYLRSSKKLQGQLYRNKAYLLDSGFFDTQTIGALKRAWKGYTIAKNKGEIIRKEYYMCLINKLQKELGIEITKFPELEMFHDEEYREAYIEQMTNDDMRNRLLMMNKNRLQFEGQ